MLRMVTTEQPTEYKQQETSRDSTNQPLAEQGDGNTFVVVEDYYKSSVVEQQEPHQVRDGFVIINQEQHHQRVNDAACGDSLRTESTTGSHQIKPGVTQMKHHQVCIDLNAIEIDSNHSSGLNRQVEISATLPVPVENGQHQLVPPSEISNGILSSLHNFFCNLFLCKGNGGNLRRTSSTPNEYTITKKLVIISTLHILLNLPR